MSPPNQYQRDFFDDFFEADFFEEDFFEELFFVVDFFAEDFFVVDFFEDADFFDDAEFFDGTLPPSRRASDRPIAIACFRLFTFWPDPLFSVPRFSLCSSVPTFSCAFSPYFAMRKSSLSMCTRIGAKGEPVSR
jgi:hypothetical protein